MPYKTKLSNAIYGIGVVLAVVGVLFHRPLLCSVSCWFFVIAATLTLLKK
jgi:hypothetical protein